MENLSSATLQSQSPSQYSETSKTGSTRTADTKDKEDELAKDNAASPIDLECHIQAERITKILDEALYKTKLAVCLSDLVEEFYTLNNMLTSQHMDDLIFVFEQYENPLFSSSLLNVAAMEDIKAGEISLKNRLNPELGHVVYIMNSYSQLKPIVEEMVEKMRLEYFKLPEEKQTNSSLEYLFAFERFRDLMVRQMETTAAEELAAKIHTRKLETSNQHLLEKIKEYSETLREESEQFEKTMKQKMETLAALEKELALLQQDANIRLKKQILDLDRQMVLMTRTHAVKGELLREEETECRESYNNILRQHLLEEKNQRARRFKVETQLLSWLQKYDVEMGDKQEELEEFTEKYEEEKQRCEELEIELAEQDKEYIPLMEEREAEYHQEMTEKMHKFMVEHAARVIQTFWRSVLANRAEKKKLKKLQKKMIAQAAAAEAAAEAAERKARRLAKLAKQKELDEQKAAKKKKKK